VRAAFVIAAVSLLHAGIALADDRAACEEAKSVVEAEAPLPHVAAAIEQHALKIVVLGTGSSVLPGPDGERNAYPARLQAALTSLLPGVAVIVSPRVRSRQTAAEMKAGEFKAMMDEHPNLVVWQTGTVDAVKGVDVDEFRQTLDQGVQKLQAHGADVVFMNMQFSPRTESMISVDVYADNMRWVALQHDVPLFDRFALMKHWVEAGTFDLTATQNTGTAERVHECIGRLLGGFVVDAMKMASPAPQAKQKSLGE